MAKNIAPKIFRKYLLRLPVSLSPLDRSSSRGFGTLSEVGRQWWSQASNPSSLTPGSQPQCAAASTNRKSRNTVLEHGVAGTQAVPGGGSARKPVCPSSWEKRTMERDRMEKSPSPMTPLSAQWLDRISSGMHFSSLRRDRSAHLGIESLEEQRQRVSSWGSMAPSVLSH